MCGNQGNDFFSWKLCPFSSSYSISERKVATIDLETLSQTADTLLQEKESFAKKGSFAKKNCLIFSIKKLLSYLSFHKKESCLNLKATGNLNKSCTHVGVFQP